MSIPANQDELRLAYAAGTLAEAPALVVATQAALDPACRRDVERYEALGGAILDAMAPAPLSAGAREDILALLDAAPREEAPDGAAGRLPAAGQVPAPLARYLPAPLERLPWRQVTRGLRDWLLPEMAGGRARLMWVRGGTALPKHTHNGPEMTLVLEGAYRDGGRDYAAGDLQLADPSVDHQPRVETRAPCLCLVVTDAPVRLTGRVGRFLNRFVRY